MTIQRFQKTKRIIACVLLAASLGGFTDLASASMHTGDTVSLKKVTVYDGKEKKVISTEADSYKRILNELKISMSVHDRFWTSTKTVNDGSVMVIERAVPVILVSEGRSKVVYTTQQTVQGVVNDAGYDWKQMMPIEDGMMQVKEGMQIHVVPYTMRKVTRTESLPIDYEKWYDEKLSADQEVVVQEGKAGKRRVEMEEIISDGKVVKTILRHESIEKEGTPGVMKTGNMEGTVGYVSEMHATAYHPSDGDGRGITATGTMAGHGTVAVDPSVIPLGSEVYIPQYGHAVAADTGGAIIGNRIDLCMETFEECYNFGRRDIEVFINY